jgi:hypothetical protein
VALMKRDHVVITRGQVGAAALLVGVIGLIWQGGITAYVAAALIVGILGIALWVIMTPREFVGVVTGRQARHGTTAFFSTLLLLGIVALIYILLQRSALTLDLTVAERFTLSPETESVLNRVSRPMRITGFYSSRALKTREVDDEFFRLYEADSNGMISRQYIDPDQQPAMAQRYGADTDGQVFLSYVNADGSTNLNSLARVPRSNTQERDMTQAISRLLISGSLTVYFDTGLGERDPNDTTQEGVSGISSGVRESGLVAYTVSIDELLQANQEIPRNAAAVLFIRPTSDLNDAQIGLIDRYLRRGGSLFLMTDVLFNDNPFMKQDGAFNNYLWQNYGLRALDAAVVDPAASGQTALDVVSAYVFPQTDLGARLDPSSNPTVFHLARAIEVNLNNSPDNVVNGQVILSSEKSYGETNLKTLGETNTFKYDEGVDIPGPLTTVAWATNRATNAKVVVVGDSDFVSNGQVLSGGNAVLFTDSMGWLTGLSEKISFAPQMYGVGVPLMFVSQQTLNLIAFLTVIVLPGGVLAGGIGIWLRRVRR